MLSLPSFSRLDARSASIAYLQSYAMIDYLDRKGGNLVFGELEADHDSILSPGRQSGPGVTAQ